MSALEGTKMDQGYLGIGKGQDRAVNRLWLAGMAMQALVGLNLADVHTIARQAYAMADAMLEADGQ